MTFRTPPTQTNCSFMTIYKVTIYFIIRAFNGTYQGRLDSRTKKIAYDTSGEDFFASLFWYSVRPKPGATLSDYTGASAILWSYLNAMAIIQNDLFYWMPCSKTSFRHTGWTDTIINCGPWKNLTTFHRNSDVNNPFYLSKILKDVKMSSMKRHNALTLSFFATEKSEKETSTFWNIISWLTACLFFPLFCWSYYFYATNSWHFVHILNYIKGQHQTKNSNEIEMKSITNRRRHRNLSSADNSRSMSCDLRWVCLEKVFR